MRVKEMHPLCCITLETPATAGDNSPVPSLGSCLSRTGSVNAKHPLPLPSQTLGASDAAGSDTTAVGGLLFKWTNYGKGWRCRWFYLRNGVLSYSKIGSPESLSSLPGFQDVRVIGEISTASARLSRMDSCGRRKPQTLSAVVNLKVASFRESRSDDKKFYIFTATRTLHLRTNSKTERATWIHALASSRGLFSLQPLSHYLSLSSPNSLSISTERLKRRLVDEGINESVVQDCEQIMQSEFSEIQGQLKVVYEERSNLLDMLRQVEATNIEEGSSSGAQDRDYQLNKNDYASVARGKYSECSTTESSDDIEKQDLEEVSDEEEHSYYDTKDCFADSPSSRMSSENECECLSTFETQANSVRETQCEENVCERQFVRRTKLPDPAEKEKAVGLWSLIKDNVGKDLTRVCLPVYFNEPISSLQKCCEDLEYSYLLDRAYECGKAGDSLGRVANIAAFAISGYATSEGRHCKPFNPLLGETYEADFPERGIRFFSEKVSHHPTVIACHCEGRGWKFWADSNLKAKFWGQSIQLDPVGALNLEFDDGEVFQWSKVTTSICNLILGKIYCDHHGTMDIRGNRQHSCTVKFKAQTFLDRNPHQVQGIIEDVSGRKLGMIVGKWDDSLYLVQGDGNGKVRDQNANACLLWTRSKPPVNLTRYNLTSFAITLNELTPGLQEKLPPTDSRLRPDQRHLENGEYEKANAEKLRLELRQRAARKIQDNGWRPRWFTQGEDGPYRFTGGYWEAREQRKWDGCPDIFGEFYEDPSI